ncbi:MAG: ECF-type sigma factor [Rhizobacter sp.]
MPRPIINERGANLRRRGALVLGYFGGLADAEIAEALEVGLRTVRRDWEKARLILSASLRG